MMHLTKKQFFAFTFLLGTLTAQAKEATQTLHLNVAKPQGWSLSKEFLSEFAHLFNADVFIETGTSRGGTVKAAKSCFREIHSIEIAEDVYQKTCPQFANDKHIHLHLGNSSTLLPKILPNITGTILFWLDGHYSGGTRWSDNTPIEEELKTLKNLGITDAIILIDDVCCFAPEMEIIPPIAQGYPTVKRLRDAIYDINPNYTFIIFGDIVLAYPPSYNIECSPLLHAMTVSRIGSAGADYATILDAEYTIATQATQEEIAALDQLCSWRADWTGCYYHLWRGLMHLYAHEYDQAANLLSKPLQKGYNDWRFAWYHQQAVRKTSI